MGNRQLKTENQEIGKKLKNARVKANLKQSDMVKELSVSKSLVSDIERGIVSPTISVLLKYCQACNMSPNEILEYMDHYNVNPELIKSVSELDQYQQIKLKDILDIIKK